MKRGDGKGKESSYEEIQNVLPEGSSDDIHMGKNFVIWMPVKHSFPRRREERRERKH